MWINNHSKNHSISIVFGGKRKIKIKYWRCCWIWIDTNRVFSSSLALFRWFIFFFLLLFTHQRDKILPTNTPFNWVGWIWMCEWIYKNNKKTYVKHTRVCHFSWSIYLCVSFVFNDHISYEFLFAQSDFSVFFPLCFCCCCFVWIHCVGVFATPIFFCFLAKFSSDEHSTKWEEKKYIIIWKRKKKTNGNFIAWFATITIFRSLD